MHISTDHVEQVSKGSVETLGGVAPTRYFNSGLNRGGGGGLAMLVQVCKPVFQNLPHSYTWPLEKQTHSYTCSSKMLTYSYTALWFFVSIYCWLLDKYHKISLKTRTSSFEKSLSEKYVHISGCQKNGALSHRNPEKSGHSYTFCWKKGGQSYTPTLLLTTMSPSFYFSKLNLFAFSGLPPPSSWPRCLPHFIFQNLTFFAFSGKL